jgi:AAA+ ATPase superfamily predicted ATPase
MENPYQYEKAVENPDDFFGRKKEINRIFALISDATEPHSISITGERKIGKSSLINFVKNEITKKKYLENPDEYVFVHLKLGQFMGYDANRFCKTLLKELSHAAVEEISSLSNNIYRALEKSVETLSLKGKKTILVLDEFDSMLEIPAFNSELLGYFRGLINGYPLSFITSSRLPLDELTKTKNSLQAEVEIGSPFFNIFYNLNLGCLEEKEALELIEKPSSRQKAKFSQEDKDFIKSTAFLHPFFIQMACYHLFNLRKERNRANGEKLDEEAYNALFSKFCRETANCWDSYLKNMNQEEKEVLLRIAKGEKVSSKTQEVVRRLHNKGLIYKENGKWNIFSSAFTYHILKRIDE